MGIRRDDAGGPAPIQIGEPVNLQHDLKLTELHAFELDGFSEDGQTVGLAAVVDGGGLGRGFAGGGLSPG